MSGSSRLVSCSYSWMILVTQKLQSVCKLFTLPKNDCDLGVQQIGDSLRNDLWVFRKLKIWFWFFCVGFWLRIDSRKAVMLAVNVSANHRDVQDRHYYQTWYITFTVYDYQPPVTSGGGGVITSQGCQMADHSFRHTTRYFQPHLETFTDIFVVTKPPFCHGNSDFSDCGNQNRYFKAKPWCCSNQEAKAKLLWRENCT